MANKKERRKPVRFEELQHFREVAEYYVIIDERYGAEWYDIPIAEREKLKIEIRKEAKLRCQ